MENRGHAKGCNSETSMVTLIFLGLFFLSEGFLQHIKKWGLVLESGFSIFTRVWTHVIFAMSFTDLSPAVTSSVNAPIKHAKMHFFRKFPDETYRTDLRRSANTKFDNKNDIYNTKNGLQRKI